MPAAAGRFPVDAAGQHVVIGGTSGFGLATAAWLASRGATQLVLASRSGQLSNEARLQGRSAATGAASTFAWRRSMSPTPPPCSGSLRSLAARGPIKGIVHAAMVLDDRLIDEHGPRGDRQGAAAQGDRRAASSEAARDLELDYLLFYSSATTLLGNPGQFNYVAANGFLEGLAQQGRLEGLPALAVAWGGIEDAGYLSRNISANASLRKRFASSLIAAEAALDGAGSRVRRRRATDDRDAARSRASTGRMAQRELAVTRAPSFAGVVPAAGARQQHKLRGDAGEAAS